MIVILKHHLSPCWNVALYLWVIYSKTEVFEYCGCCGFLLSNLSAVLHSCCTVFLWESALLYSTRKLHNNSLIYVTYSWEYPNIISSVALSGERWLLLTIYFISVGPYTDYHKTAWQEITNSLPLPRSVIQALLLVKWFQSVVYNSSNECEPTQ